jgi:hypothetical protein
MLTQNPSQILQFLFADNPPGYTRSAKHYSPTSYSPAAQVVDGGTCESPPPFPTEPPISRPHKMALLAEAKRVAAEFALSDDDVRKTVVEFIEEMSAYYNQWLPFGNLIFDYLA